MRDVSRLLDDKGNPEEIVAIAVDGPVDLAQFRRDVAANAEALAAQGCARGLLVTEDTYWCAVGMLALFQAGAEVVLPQNVTFGACGAIRRHWDLLVYDRLPPGHNPGFALRKGTGSVPVRPSLDAKRCRLTLFTSGSTGTAKRVEKTFATMLREALAIETLLGKTVPPRGHVLGTVTHQHLFGLSYKLIWPLCSGRPFGGRVHVLWESLLAEDLGGAAIITGPAHLARLNGLGVHAGRRPPSCILSAGAALPDTAAVVAQASLGARICEIYGSTETGTIAARWRDRPNPPWQAAPGVTLATAADGTLTVTSPFLPDDEPHATSDAVEMAEGSGFYLKGRTDRIVKIEGKRVSLPEVEAALASFHQVAAAALVTLPGEPATLGAVIVPSESGTADLAKLGAFRFGRLLRQALATRHDAAAMPRRWRFIDVLPADAMGKIRREDLLAIFASPQSCRTPELRAIRRRGDTVELDLFNRPDMIQLDGHFPGLPIVPGVAQIDWAVKLAARHLSLPIAAATDYQVKFQRLTLPNTLVTLKLTHDADRGRLSFSYQSGDEILTAGIIRLAAA